MHEWLEFYHQCHLSGVPIWYAIFMYDLQSCGSASERIIQNIHVISICVRNWSRLLVLSYLDESFTSIWIQWTNFTIMQCLDEISFLPFYQFSQASSKSLLKEWMLLHLNKPFVLGFINNIVFLMLENICYPWHCVPYFLRLDLYIMDIGVDKWSCYFHAINLKIHCSVLQIIYFIVFISPFNSKQC